MSLKRKTAGAVAWSVLSQAAILTNQFVVNIALARILSPDEFGLVAMVVVFTGFAALFVELGMGTALVQLENLEPRHESSVFWLQLGSGTALTGLAVLAAPLVGWFYAQPSIVPVMRLLAFNFFLLSVGVVQMRLQQRQMQIRRLALIELFAEVVAGALGIGLALAGHGVYALAWRVLTSSALQSALLWATTGWRPRSGLDGAAVRQVLGFGASYTMTLVVNYWTKKVGDFIVGRFLGPRDLGLYNRSYSIMLQPITQMTMIVTRVMFPVLARMQNDDDRVRKTYVRAVSAVGLVTFPVTLGLVATADSFVVGLMGPHWADMVPVLQLLCVASAINSVDATAGQLFLVRGNTQSLFRWRLATSVVTILGFVIGAQWGVIGVAAGYAIRSAFLMAFNFQVPGKLIGMKVRQVLRALAPTFFAALGMAGVAVAVGWVLRGSTAEWARFLMQVAAGGVTYWCVLHFGRVAAYRDVLGLMADLRKRKAGSDAHAPDRAVSE